MPCNVRERPEGFTNQRITRYRTCVTKPVPRASACWSVRFSTPSNNRSPAPRIKGEMWSRNSSMSPAERYWRAVCAPPAMARPGKHVAPHDEGTRGKDPLNLRRIGLPVFEHPSVQELSAVAQRFVQALVGAGDKCIQGNRQITGDLAHAPIMPPRPTRVSGPTTLQ